MIRFQNNNYYRSRGLNAWMYIFKPGTLHRETCKSSCYVRGESGYLTLILDYISWLSTVPLDFSQLLLLTSTHAFFFLFTFFYIYMSAHSKHLDELSRRNSQRFLIYQQAITIIKGWTSFHKGTFQSPQIHF